VWGVWEGGRWGNWGGISRDGLGGGESGLRIECSGEVGVGRWEGDTRCAVAGQVGGAFLDAPQPKGMPPALVNCLLTARWVAKWGGLLGGVSVIAVKKDSF